MPLRRLRNLLRTAAPKLFLYPQTKSIEKLIIPTRPRVTKYQSVTLAEKLFSLQTSRSTACVREFDSYKDRNFLIKGKVTGTAHDKAGKTGLKEDVYVLKVLNSVCSRNPRLIDTISELLFLLNSNGIRCPEPQPSIFGTRHVACKLLKKRFHDDDILDSEPTEDKDACDTFELVSDVACETEDDVYIVRLLSFLPGKMLCDAQVRWSSELLAKLGVRIAIMHRIFKEFSDTKSPGSLEGLRKPFEWDIRNFADVLSICYHVFEDNVHKRNSLEEIATQLQNDILPSIARLDQQLIHGDPNAHNIIVRPPAEGNNFEIEGFIDFDHMHYSSRVIDISMALAYLMLDSESHGLDPIESANHVLTGYQSEFPLSGLELGMILKLVMVRIGLSISMGAYNYKYNNNLDKDYVLYTANQGWKVIDHLLKIVPEDYKLLG